MLRRAKYKFEDPSQDYITILDNKVMIDPEMKPEYNKIDIDKIREEHGIL